MPHRVLRAFVPLAVVLALVLVTLPSPARAITWGTLDNGAHPAVGTIVVGYPAWGYIFYQLCTGTLVATNLFLTAGHCTDALGWWTPPWMVWVTFAGSIHDPEATWHQASAWVTHPDFGRNGNMQVTPVSNSYDVGVIVLLDAIATPSPVALPTAHFLDGVGSAALKEATLLNVGYGADENLVPTGIREDSVSGFLSLHEAWLYMLQNQAVGYGGTCYGDSGGPTFYVDATGHETLVAITSWGDAMCVATNINYRVDVPSTLDFIASVAAAYPVGS